MTGSRSQQWSALLISAVVATIFCVSGCDTSVDVLNPSEDLQYSLFGVLNVAADTQIVRVEPLGDTTRLGAPRELEANVVLENLDMGTRISLQDSYDTVSGGIAQVHNFSTTHPIEPGTSYRVVVLEDGSPVTTATTTTPGQPPTLRHNPEVSDDEPFRLPCELNNQGYPTERRNTFSFRVLDVQNIAAVKVRYAVKRPSLDTVVVRAFDNLDAAKYDAEREFYRVPVFYGEDLQALAQQTLGCISFSQFAEPYASVAVTAGGPDWPDWRGASLDELARPDTFSNVEGGHGFVGGVYTDTIRIPVEARE